MAEASRQLQQKSVGADVQSAATTYVPKGREGCEPLQDGEVTAGRNVEDIDDGTRKTHRFPICNERLR